MPRHSAEINCGRTSSKERAVKQHVDQPGGRALLQFCMLELEFEAIIMRGPRQDSAQEFWRWLNSQQLVVY